MRVQTHITEGDFVVQQK